MANGVETGLDIGDWLRLVFLNVWRSTPDGCNNHRYAQTKHISVKFWQVVWAWSVGAVGAHLQNPFEV